MRSSRSASSPPLWLLRSKRGIMHVLVTGGAGFIGSHLTQALLARGDSVAVLDNLSTGSIENIKPLTH